MSRASFLCLLRSAVALVAVSIVRPCASDQEDGSCAVGEQGKDCEAPCQSCDAADDASCLPCRQAFEVVDVEACLAKERSTPHGSQLAEDYSPETWGLQDMRAKKSSEDLKGLVKGNDRQAAFTTIYSGDVWNGGSGPGSRWQSTEGARCALTTLRSLLGFQSLWDVCGDFQWMHGWLSQHSEITYQGADVVQELVDKLQKRHGRSAESDRGAWSFVQADIVCGEGGTLPQPHGFDVVLLREVLQHQTPREVLESLRCVSKSGAGWLLVTHVPKWILRLPGRNITLASKNLGIESGIDALDAWRTHWYDLTEPPYSLPQPVWSIQDGGKALGLWKLPLQL